MAWEFVSSYSTGIIGVFGLVLLIMAWIPQTLATIKTKKVGMRRGFIVLYLLGSLLLVVHSVLIDDPVFLVLNAGAALVAAVNLYYSLMSKSKS